MVDLFVMGADIRKVNRMQNLITAEDTRNDSDVMDICAPILDELRQMQEELAPMIETLDSYEERLVMTLRYLKGFRCPAIAERLGLCTRSMYRYLLFAKNHLKERYPDKIEL